MSEFYLIVAIFLLVNLGIGLVRLNRGPGRIERLLSAQLITTTTVGVLLLLAETQSVPALRDVALVFTLLAVVVSVAFVRLPLAILKEEQE